MTDLTTTDLYRADEMFLTGTMGKLAPVVKVDGRTIGGGEPGRMTAKLTELFRAEVARSGQAVL